MGLGGSKMLDDRRRRRLVLDAETDRSAAAAARPAGDTAGSFEPGPPNLWLSPLNAIPRRLWQCWAIGAFCSGIFLSLLVAMRAADSAAISGDELGELLLPLLDRLLQAAGAAAWWTAGQLSCLIWWVRSRSRVDYGGRFHVWGWSAAVFALAAMLCLTDAHRALAQLVAWTFTGITTNSTAVTAVWLLPLLVIGLVQWGTLGTEFREDWSSRVLHMVAALAALSLIGVELSSVRSKDPSGLEFVGRIALAVLQWCNLMSVWLHVRHVVHVSADPPTLSSSGWLLAWRYGPGRIVSALRRTAVVNSEDHPRQEPLGGDKRRRLRPEATSLGAQEVRIDDAEPTAKGPTKRTQAVTRKHGQNTD